MTMSGKMKANPGSGRMWNLLAIYKMAAPYNRRLCSTEHSRTCPRPCRDIECRMELARSQPVNSTISR